MSAPTVLYHTQNSWIAQLDPQIPAQSMDSCTMYGSTDCAAQSMDCADPQIAPNIFVPALVSTVMEKHGENLVMENGRKKYKVMEG